jgi:2-keto-4-pentenoate hydratase
VNHEDMTSQTTHGTSPVALEAVENAARRLQAAADSGTPCAPVRDLIGTEDVHAAYAVQEKLTANRLAQGGVVVGRKIGLTSPAVQRQLRVDQPDFGVLFSDMQIEENEPISMNRLLQPKVEAEIAFVLGTDLDEGPLDEAQVRAAVDYAVAALEIVDSRIAGWDIRFADTVADNGSSALFVLGSPHVPLAEFEPVAAEMTMSTDGVVTSQGNGAACLGDPLNALAWLARTARDFGAPLRAGQIVLSGALGPMVPVEPNTVVTADVSGLGQVTATFSAAVKNEQGAHA